MQHLRVDDGSGHRDDVDARRNLLECADVVSVDELHELDRHLHDDAVLSGRAVLFGHRDKRDGDLGSGVRMR